MLHDIKQARLEKLNNIRKAGQEPYPARVKRDYFLKEAIDDFEALAKSSKEIFLVGRIMAIRVHGKVCFANIFDGTAKLQIYFKEDELPAEKYNFFLDNFDIGDFIEARGALFETHRGEKTLLVKDYKIIAKSLLPLPEKWHGLQDIEERLRKRYLDIIFNPETRDLIEKKAKFWNAMRAFLIKKGFLEVETPILENMPGGAEARPFKTHHHALDIDIYLRISDELWLKRLMVAGFPKVFEIGRIFRNEGMDDEHLQDYTQMEFYWAFADYRDGMKLTEKLYKYVAEKTFGTLQFKIRGFDIDLSKKWKKYDFTKIIKEKTGIDVLKTNADRIANKLKELGVEYDRDGFNLTRGIDNLWKYCRKSMAGPGFLINVPVFMDPLAKRKTSNPKLVERFQIIIAGSELGKGFSELNDPQDQAMRFEEQQKLREAGDEEAQRYDKDFVEALEYGMPPTCGFGTSERLFAFLADKSARECQIFPLMRPKNE